MNVKYVNNKLDLFKSLSGGGDWSFPLRAAL